MFEYELVAYSDVDANSEGNDSLNGGNARSRGRNLDVDVGAVDHFVKPFGSLDGAVGLIRQFWRHFYRDVTVRTVGLVVDSLEQLARVLDVLHHKLPIHRIHVFPRFYQLSARNKYPNTITQQFSEEQTQSRYLNWSL